MERRFELPAMSGRSAFARRVSLGVVFALVTLAADTGVVAASMAASGLTGGSSDVTIPTWLYLATGGGTVGASALLTMLVTDRDMIGTYHDRSLEATADRLRTVGSRLVGLLGLLGFVTILVAGFVGPA